MCGLVIDPRGSYPCLEIALAFRVMQNDAVVSEAAAVRCRGLYSNRAYERKTYS